MSNPIPTEKDIADAERYVYCTNLRYMDFGGDINAVRDWLEGFLAHVLAEERSKPTVDQIAECDICDGSRMVMSGDGWVRDCECVKP